MIKNIERTSDGVNALIDRARDGVVDATDRAEHGIAATAEHAVKASHEAGEYLRDEADAVARGARRKVQMAARAVDHGYTRTRGDLANAATAATDFVADHPGKSLLLAASAGFVLGLMAHRST